MSTLQERLKSLRSENKITQRKLANDLNCSYSTIALYETGHRNPDNDTLKKLADYFDVSTDYLLGRSDIKDLPKGAFKLDDSIKIPIVGTIRAVEPILADENIVGYEFVTPDSLPSGELFGLKVIGDSMDLSHITDGSTVVVHKQEVVENGEIAVVMVNGEDATIKKFYKTDTTVTLMPHSSNPKHQPRVIDITKSNIKIIGKVVKITINT